MRESDTTFKQVKQLLRRMDTSIDEARERRRAREAVSHSNAAHQKAAARNPEAQAIRDRLREIGSYRDLVQLLHDAAEAGSA